MCPDTRPRKFVASSYSQRSFERVWPVNVYFAWPPLSLSAIATCSDTDRGLLTSIDHDMNNEWIHRLNNACINVEQHPLDSGV